jgi:hypothetical protein
MSQVFAALIRGLSGFVAIAQHFIPRLEALRVDNALK